MTKIFIGIAIGIFLDKNWTNRIRPFLVTKALPWSVSLFHRVRRK